MPAARWSRLPLQRFWYSTKNFYFSLDEMMITLTDFYMLTGPFGLNLMRYYPDPKLKRQRHVELFGYLTKRWSLKSNFIKYSLIKDVFKGSVDGPSYKHIFLPF